MSEREFPRLRLRGGRSLGGSVDLAAALRLETYSGLRITVEGEVLLWYFSASYRVFFSERMEQRSQDRMAIELATNPAYRGVTVELNNPEPQGGQSCPA